MSSVSHSMKQTGRGISRKCCMEDKIKLLRNKDFHLKNLSTVGKYRVSENKIIIYCILWVYDLGEHVLLKLGI